MKNSRLVKEFIKDFEKALLKTFTKHSKLSQVLDEGYHHPAFWYGEQQTKTFVAIALAVISERYLQEAPIIRGDDAARGRVDFMCHYGSNVFLIEFKQRWIEHSESRKFPHDAITKEHSSVLNQIKDTESSDWEESHVLGISLFPIYVNTAEKKTILDKKMRAKMHRTFKAEIESIKGEKELFSAKYFESHEMHFCPIDPGYGKNHQIYPGYVLSWHVRDKS